MELLPICCTSMSRALAEEVHPGLILPFFIPTSVFSVRLHHDNTLLNDTHLYCRGKEKNLGGEEKQFTRRSFQIE